MSVTIREFGAGPSRPRGAGSGGTSLLVLEAAPQAPLVEPVVAADLVVDADMLIRALGDAGLPMPILPPIPHEKAEALSTALGERGIEVVVRPTDRWARLQVLAVTLPDPLETAQDEVMSFVLRGGLWEHERHGLAQVLREMVQNAALHGNAWTVGKKVTIDAVVIDDCLTLSVADQGAGFDHGAWAADLDDPARGAVERATERAAGGGRGGLGLFMIRQWADVLRWTDGGRCCVVEKTNDAPES